MFDEKKFIKYICAKIKKRIDAGEDIDKQRFLKELQAMSASTGMLEKLCEILKSKKQGHKNKVNSYIAYLFGATTAFPDGEFKPHFHFDLARVSHLDVDIDFDFFYRNNTYKYLKERYGEERTANIGTYQRLKAKNAVKSAIKAMNPMKDPKKNLEFEMFVSELIMNDPKMTLKKALKDSKELQKLAKKHRDVFKVALVIEGLCSYASKHPAGIVVSDVPIKEVAPLHRTKKDTYATQFEMNELEDVGLIKYDILALKTLSIFDMVTKDLKNDLDVDLNLDDIPLDDPDALTLIARGRTESVFQLEGRGMKNLLRDMKVSTFHDVAAANALHRPGAMSADADTDYCQCKHGHKKVTYDHDVLIPILEDTYGQLIYQEQCQQISMDLAGFTRVEADKLRKAIGKKVGKIFEKLQSQFVEGSVMRSGISKAVATEIWDKIEKMGGYAFNKSHAYAYAVLALQCAYLKTHYPLYYMKSVLNSETLDPSTKHDQIDRYMRECHEMKIQILPANINKSRAPFSIEGNSIRRGLASIKGVGLKASLEIEALAPFRDLEDFVDKTQDVKVVNKKIVETLILEGAFSDFDIYDEDGIEEFLKVRDYVAYRKKHKIQKSSMFEDLDFSGLSFK
jgi:DNA polymerase-3 subunit alpha